MITDPGRSICETRRSWPPFTSSQRRQALAAELGVSNSPVREAMLALVDDGSGVTDYEGEILEIAAIAAGSPAGYVAAPREALPGKERTA